MAANKRALKEVELKLLVELMKNCRRSDREIARNAGVSQPTVSRIINRLQKEGMISEYTAIPNLPKLGYEILAMTFVALNHTLNDKEIEEAKKLIKQTLKVMPLEILMLERGIGMGYDGVIISCHKDYDSHNNFLRLLRETGLLDLDKIEVFRVNLQDNVRFLPLSYSLLAQSLASTSERKQIT